MKVKPLYMPGFKKITTNHEEIRQWIEKRGGAPEIEETGQNEGKNLHIAFPPDRGIEPGEEKWKDFFSLFEEKRLAFLYEESEGTEDRYFRFIDRNLAELAEDEELGIIQDGEDKFP